VRTANAYQEFQGYPIKCMVWGAIGPNYKSPLIWFKEHVTCETYVQKLTEYQIFESLDLLYGHGQYVFQQDGARPHTALVSLRYLSGKTLMLPFETPWPPCSPDLSPIEQIWAYMKRFINLHNVTDAQGLFNEVNRIWNGITMEDVNRYVNTLKPRIWTLEDLHGFSLAGHNDMIRIYQEHGYRGRMEARKIVARNCIPPDISRNWYELMQTTLKQLTDIIATSDLNRIGDIGDFRASAQKFHNSLPCGKT
jgi:hypothetical protein